MGFRNEPLTESYFYILLCLYEGANHGYGIMQEAERLSEGTVRIGSGTMYGATGNMMKKCWIQEVSSEDAGEKRKRMYELTDEGKKVLMDEIMRLKKLVESYEIVIQEAGKNGKED